MRTLRIHGSLSALIVLLSCLGSSVLASAAEDVAKPAAVFMKYCGDCHADGAMEGSLALDELLAAGEPTADRPKWVSVWKNLRAQLMPPADMPQPSDEEKRQLLGWIEQRVFQLDPANPDPGRVTIRRLNRTEYRHTIRDLFGVDFDTTDAFPADDTGYGFDTIGDVLSLSPLQVEKYLEAGQEIVSKAVPTSGAKPPTINVAADAFRDPKDPKRPRKTLPFAEGGVIERVQHIDHPGAYDLRFEYRTTGSPEATSNTAVLTVRVGDENVRQQDLGWETDNRLTLVVKAPLAKGANRIALELTPKDPPGEDEKPLEFEIRKLELHGPLDGSFLEYPPGYRRVFFDGPPPADPAARTTYARKILRHFADRAFRRPIDEPSLTRLVDLAMQVDGRSKEAGFEKGIATALTTVLASPRFLFRAEAQPEPDNSSRVAPLDEFALASRLSYFLWSSLPDDELFELARQGKLRAQLRPQVDRMLADAKFERFIDSFVGQWLRSRDVETVGIDPRRILKLRDLGEALRIFSRNLRHAMRDETEMMVAHLVAENRSVLDLLTADYTFLNEELANWYGVPGVKGREMRKVDLPEDSPRGGVLTHASFLVVTSNPTRTSPVKRGLFVMENILGTPAPAPPPDVPPLEAAAGGRKEKLSMRELMVKHREDALCASCHARMDPLGLALEEFDALGRWRDEDQGQPIDTAGQLITGEPFADIRELSRVIATERRTDFYNCLAEKMLTYALGRGVEYYDAPAIDGIVEGLERDGGRIRSLIYGIVESVPFQMRRGDGNG